VSNTADVAQDNKTRKVDEESTEKGVAHIPPGEGARSLWVMGVLATSKIPSHKTGGAYALFEVATQPGSGPPPHIHHREDESFYVIEGDYEFLIGRETLRVGAGTLLYAPKGTLHAHKNVGEDVGRLLVTQTPGGLYERFFEKVGKPVGGEAGPPAEETRLNSERIAAIGVEYGIEIPLPVAQRGRA
jgi:mannose-6-phosphate isomerase-like protein (cupin superfamily)